MQESDILRDVEQLPTQARAQLAKKRLADEERRLGLKPFIGDSEQVFQAAKLRIALIGQLLPRRRSQAPEHQRWRYDRLDSEFRRQGAGFWVERLGIVVAGIVSLHETRFLAPFEVDSPESRAAARTYIRFRDELHYIRFRDKLHTNTYDFVKDRAGLDRKPPEFWSRAKEYTTRQILVLGLLGVDPFPVDLPEYRAAEKKRAQVLADLWGIDLNKKKIIDSLRQKDPVFWVRAKEFTTKQIYVLGLLSVDPFPGDLPEYITAEKARVEVLEELWNNNRIKKNKKTVDPLVQKDPEFWIERQDRTALEIYVPCAVGVVPFSNDTPMSISADKARSRILAQLYEQRWTHKRYRRDYKKIVEDLQKRQADFWYAHKDFSLEEILELWHPDAKPDSVTNMQYALRALVATIALSIAVSLILSALVNFSVIEVPSLFLNPNMGVYWLEFFVDMGNSLWEIIGGILCLGIIIGFMSLGDSK